MALIKCPECQQTISDKAPSCPHCGAPRDAMTAPPPLPPPIPQQTKKRGSVARQAALYILVGLVGMLFLLHITDDKQAPSQPAAQLSDNEHSSDAKREADEQARKQAEEAKCNADLQCIGDKKSIEATFACAPYVERLAKNDFEWIDKWYEPKFSHFRWKDQQHLVITYIGDKIKYQNGFGGWVLSRYECDYNIPDKTVLDARASPGRLSP